MIKLFAVGAVALALGGISDAAQAQTSTQWSQLVNYVGQQSKLILDQRSRIERLEAENAQQRTTINAAIAALDQERCRVSRLTGVIKDMLKDPPILPTWVENVACIDLKSPVPPFPQPLPAPQ
jgi:septal ring factor EnvC (AmiA/AmiB activator)